MPTRSQTARQISSGEWSGNESQSGGGTSISASGGDSVSGRRKTPSDARSDAIAAAIWAFQAALPGYIGGALIQDQPWLAMVFGFALSPIMAGGIALFQRWWDRRKRVPVEVPIQPAVVGIGGVDAKIAAKVGPGPASAEDADTQPAEAQDEQVADGEEAPAR